MTNEEVRVEMTCDEATAHLTALADGELAADLAAAVRAHLDACPGCLAGWEAELSVRTFADRWVLPGGSVVSPGVQAQIAAEERAALRDEMIRMREEMAALRAEVVGLRRELAARPAPRASAGLLFPHAPASASAALRIV